MSARICRVALCENSLPRGSRPTTVYCSACRSSFGYWAKRGISRMWERQEKLKLYMSRMLIIARRK